ncbi:dTDP-4-dehydrorhamnose reductase [Paenibacillus baekrokdamisoli]|uniref:dTDP-4-dehydrorhamnose reductase n=1 Tax=Paenibacillus baekrokdamisoli TaxID=1712516 RepID=UPI000F7762B9|nr:dTDP-4-dehydrorhamnose reductase [Paenibacillus baekrokdamisoli]
MKVFITGANGQLGAELANLSINGLDIKGLGRDGLDITSLEQCRHVISEYRPDVIIHCAAYTAVDKAESEPEEAFRINSEGTYNIAASAKECGAKLCYLSTDYVFDGQGKLPYEENDSTNPQSVYGKSKLAGELAVASLLSRYFIVRTSWVFGKYGHNFVHTMLKLANDQQSLKVVSDQIGSPTYSLDLAHFLLQLVQTENYGIYHASNTGSCSWYDFAQAIFKQRALSIKVEPCLTEEFPRPAPRPSYSVLNHGAIHRHGMSDLRPWKEALFHYLYERA